MRKLRGKKCFSRSYRNRSVNCFYHHHNYRSLPFNQPCNRRNCPDFQAAGKYPTPTRLCSSCNRRFYGDNCYESHAASTTRHRSRCEVWRVCLNCCHLYECAPYMRHEAATHPKYKHKCGLATCPFCNKYESQQTHKCYIQPIPEDEDEPKILCVPHSEVAARTVLGIADEQTGGCYVEANKPLFVYADYEATTDEHGVQTPILLCCESAEEEDTTVFYGRDCTDRFFDYLDDLTIDEYGNTRQVIVLFHNFKGYDGMFVLKYLYDNHRIVEQQINVGAKVLSLRNGDHLQGFSLFFTVPPGLLSGNLRFDRTV